MKQFIFIALMFACGIKPITKPWNCSGEWVCVCDADRNCEWELRCE